MDNRLPPEFQPLLDGLVETHSEGEIQHLTVQTVAGARFEVARPPISDEMERELLGRIRAMLGEE